MGHCFERRSPGSHGVVACSRVWSSVGLCPLNASVSLITGKEDIPFHLWVRIQEGTMTESLTRFPPGKNRGSLEEHRRSDLRRREKIAQGSTTRSPPPHPGDRGWGPPKNRLCCKDTPGFLQLSPRLLALTSSY